MQVHNDDDGVQYQINRGNPRDVSMWVCYVLELVSVKHIPVTAQGVLLGHCLIGSEIGAETLIIQYVTNYNETELEPWGEYEKRKQIKVRKRTVS